MKRYLSIVLSIFFIITITGCQADKNDNYLEDHSLVHEGTEISDSIPVSIDKNGEEYYNPTKVAIYAIQYCGQNSMVETEVEPDEEKALECIEWLISNATVSEDGSYVWKNIVHDEYSDITNDAEWIGAYTQATVIEAFLSYYIASNDEAYLQYALDASKVLTKNMSEGGLLLEEKGEVWFETIKREKEQYDLIGNIRVIVALSKLLEIVDDSVYRNLYDKAVNTLENRFSFYDTDYCIKDNLCLKQNAIKFRFFCEYGNVCDTDTIENIILRDPLTEEAVKIEKPDASGEFVCHIPSDINDCFRTEWLELIVTYQDTIEQHMTLQKESLINEEDWISIKDGDILFTGSGNTKEWIVPIRIEDLGYTVSESLSGQYKKIFETLAADDNRFDSMKNRSAAYYNLNSDYGDYQIVTVEKRDLPLQTPNSTVVSFDGDGVLRQHNEILGVTEYDDNGKLTENAIMDGPSYSLYVINKQAIFGKDYWKGWYNLDISLFKNQEFWQSYDFLTKDNLDRIESTPAYRWIEENAKRENGIATWKYDTYNCYNDLEQEAGWISAYGQAMMLEALMQYPHKYEEIIKEGCYAYSVPVEDGGYAAYDYANDIWFEEVPNKSHILNANILSINTLDKVNEIMDDDNIAPIILKSEESLKNNLWRYDTGYWSKYDMNPNKEILFQIDWISGEASPLIDEIMLCDPVSECANIIDVGEESDFESYPYIVGTEWEQAQEIDGVTVRSFANGYLREHEITNGSTEQNTYFLVTIPKLVQDDYFDLMPYKLLIRYKDIAQGSFEIKRQSISEGNYLKFEQLPNAKIECIGDGKWKEAEIIIRPQDLGWYMGAEYQTFHIEQLRKLADATGDWFFEQYAEKWEYYLNRK